MMNRLRFLRTYLCGPIENCPTAGTSWRKEITPWLHSKGIIVLDPTNKPIKFGNENMENRKYVQELRDSKKWDELSANAKDIIKVDLRMLDASDFMIVYLNNDISIAGTAHEIVANAQRRHPTLVVCEQGKKYISSWWYGLLDHNEFFNNWLDLKAYLAKIDQGQYNPSNKWLFFDKEVLQCHV